MYLVKTDKGDYPCKLKGNFKLNEIRTTNPIAVGDLVEIELPEEQEMEAECVGWISSICPRKNYIIRRSSNLSKQAHIIGANLDRVLLIVTVNYPVTSTTFIDRFLSTAEAYGVEVGLVFNKVDRYGEREHAEMTVLTEVYESVGYRCFHISARNHEGLSKLHQYISTGVTLVSGHSGVGKSTFINALVPHVHLRTAEISEANNTGVHTTTFSEMIPYGNHEGCYLIDTPGIKGFGTIEFDKETVGHFFPEIFEYSKECHYGDCTHTHEPGCSVLKACRSGHIAPSRYKSYLSILNEEDDGKYRL